MSNFSSSDYPIIRRGGGQYSYKVLGTAPANLLAYWKLAEASGTTVTDSSGNGRNGTYANATLGVAGIGDGLTCASFNGTNTTANCYSVSLANAFRIDEFTVMAWVKNSDWASATTVSYFSFVYSYPTDVLRLTRYLGLEVFRSGNSSFEIVQIDPAQLTNSAWLNITITCSASANKTIVYINGVQKGQTTCTASTNNNPSIISVGYFNAGQWFWNDTMAHVAIWSTPLSAAQIANLATV